MDGIDWAIAGLAIAPDAAVARTPVLRKSRLFIGVSSLIAPRREISGALDPPRAGFLGKFRFHPTSHCLQNGVFEQD
jgi:hypothetical protein